MSVPHYGVIVKIRRLASMVILVDGAQEVVLPVGEADMVVDERSLGVLTALRQKLE